MCIHVSCGGRTYATPRQLSELIGGPQGLVWLEHAGEMDWFLCTIDISKTLDLAGLTWTQSRAHKTFVVEQ